MQPEFPLPILSLFSRLNEWLGLIFFAKALKCTDRKKARFNALKHVLPGAGLVQW